MKIEKTGRERIIRLVKQQVVAGNGMHRTYMRVSLCGPRGRGAWRKTGRSQRLPQCEYTEKMPWVWEFPVRVWWDFP